MEYIWPSFYAGPEDVYVTRKSVQNISTTSSYSMNPIKPLPGKKKEFNYIRAVVDSRMSVKVMDRIRKPVICNSTIMNSKFSEGCYFITNEKPKASDFKFRSDGSKNNLEYFKAHPFSQRSISNWSFESVPVSFHAINRRMQKKTKKEELTEDIDANVESRLEDVRPSAGLPSLRRTFSVADCIHWSDESTGAEMY